MKFEIDTTDKTVRLLSDGAFSELSDSLKEVLGEKIYEYKILGTHGFFEMKPPTVSAKQISDMLEKWGKNHRSESYLQPRP